MKTFAALLLAAWFTSAALPLHAEDYAVLDQRADEFDRWQERVDSSYGNPVVAREAGVPVTVLEEQRTRTHLGYGGLMMANGLASETGRSFDEIAALKQGGMGWGRIAQENNVKLGAMVSRLDRADVEFKKVKVKGHGKHGKKKGHGKRHRGHGGKGKK